MINIEIGDNLFLVLNSYIDRIDRLQYQSEKTKCLCKLGDIIIDVIKKQGAK